MEFKEKAMQFPDAPGVYFMKDSGGRVLYIGKAVSLRDRVSSYFQAGASHPARTEAMLRKVADVEYIEAPSEVEALLMESRLIKDIQPKYNASLKDSKSFPLLAITQSGDFPHVCITRERGLPRTKYFGPFIDGKGLRHALKMLQKSFKFRTCKMEIRSGDEKRLMMRPCVLHSISLCSAPCAGRIERREYRQMIGTLIAFLSGKRTRIVKSLDRHMKEAAARQAFEEAAQYRDRLKAILALSKRGGMDDLVGLVLDFPDPAQGLSDLAEKLGIPELPRTIEGVDISDIGGKEATGAVVTFLNGVPHKQGYRRFRIKTVEGTDDYAMMKEVVRRRLSRLESEGGERPDVLLLDGGLGHLNAVAEELRKVGAGGIRLVAIAKGEERLFLQGQSEPLILERTAPALRLLQYVRDEAHRFAQHYHRLLRQRALGLGRHRARRQAASMPQSHGDTEHDGRTKERKNRRTEERKNQ